MQRTHTTALSFRTNFINSPSFSPHLPKFLTASYLLSPPRCLRVPFVSSPWYLTLTIPAACTCSEIFTKMTQVRKQIGRGWLHGRKHRRNIYTQLKFLQSDGLSQTHYQLIESSSLSFFKSSGHVMCNYIRFWLSTSNTPGNGR
jgi:hypothetical protein